MGIATSFKVESANLEELHVDFVLLREFKHDDVSAPNDFGCSQVQYSPMIFLVSRDQNYRTLKTAQNCAK